MNRRSFFRGIAQAAAIVALAPQLAFRVRALSIAAPIPAQVSQVLRQLWYESSEIEMCCTTEYLAAFERCYPLSKPPS